MLIYANFPRKESTPFAQIFNLPAVALNFGNMTGASFEVCLLFLVLAF